MLGLFRKKISCVPGPLRPKYFQPVKRAFKATQTANGSITWPSFTGTATFVGTSPSGTTNVYYDATLGAQALANAKALVAKADKIRQIDSAIFGTKGGSVNVIIFALGGATDGTGGADHASCDFTTGQNIEVCASYGNNPRVYALFEAELSECQMGGNLCGSSTGEALSRWCSILVAPYALLDFASAPTWQQDGQANWVDTTEATDQDYDSIGCGMAFLSWLQHLGYTMYKIAPAMVALGTNGTLAQLYTKLTGKTTAWTDFTAAVKAKGKITNDDPFRR